MTDERPSDAVLASWAEVSARSRARPVVQRDAVRARRPAGGVGVLATVAVAIAVVGAVAIVKRGNGPWASSGPGSSAPSAVAVGPTIQGSTAPVSPSSSATRQPGANVVSGQLVTALDGWAFSNGALVVTHDGARSWTATTPPAPVAERIVGVAFADQLHGWVVGDTYPADGASGDLVVNVHRTDDDGATWDTVVLATIPSPGPAPTIGFPTFSILTSDQVFIMLALPDAPGFISRLYATGDGGRTWERRAGVTEGSSFAFLDETQGWAIRGDTTALVRSVDGGRSWSRATLPAVPGANPRDFYPTVPIQTSIPGSEVAGGRLVLYEAAARDGDAGIVLASDDGGSTWHLIARTPVGSSGRVTIVGGGTWIIGSDPLQITHDGGATWSPVDSGLPGSAGAIAVADFPHLSALVPVVPPGCGDCFVPTELWISDDGGQTWRNATP